MLPSTFNIILFLASKMKLAWFPSRERGRKEKKESDLAVCYPTTNTHTHKAIHSHCDTHKIARHDLCLEENTNTPEKQRAYCRGKYGIIHFSKA